MAEKLFVVPMKAFLLWILWLLIDYWHYRDTIQSWIQLICFPSKTSKSEFIYFLKTKFILIFFRHFIASGSQDGILAIYALETGECLCQKQLFGRIEVVKAKDDILATAHFGKDYDMGCITVRRIVSPNDLPVIFSIYQVRKFSFLSTFLVNLVLVVRKYPKMLKYRCP